MGKFLSMAYVMNTCQQDGSAEAPSLPPFITLPSSCPKVSEFTHSIALPMTMDTAPRVGLKCQRPRGVREKRGEGRDMPAQPPSHAPGTTLGG